jgi:hypothetical protein
LGFDKSDHFKTTTNDKSQTQDGGIWHIDHATRHHLKMRNVNFKQPPMRTLIEQIAHCEQIFLNFKFCFNLIGSSWLP